MNYIKIYNNLIDFRLKNPPIEFFEKHHIKPKSLFPELENDPNNIVKLTYKEHYLVHHLLYRYYKSIGDKIATSKMACAWFRTCYRENGLKVTALQFEKAKISIKKRYVSDETRKKISFNHADISGEKNPNFGREFSIQHRKRISEARKKFKASKEQCEKHRKDMLGRIWVNNNINEKFVLPINIPEGYKKGRLKKED